MNKIISLLSVLIFSLTSYSQMQKEVKIEKWLCCNLHDAITDLSKISNIKILYDIEKFKKVTYSLTPRTTTLNKILVSICKKNKLKFYMSKDSVIHIVDRWFDSENELLEVAQKYSGPPSKKDFTINGKIFDTKTLESIPFGTILVKGTTIGAITNVDGFFTLLNVPTDTATLEVRYIGYAPKTIYLTPETKVENIRIELKPESINLSEVNVVAERQDVLRISTNQISMIKMSPQKLNMLPNLGEKDILRSFQLMPGISAANENSSGLYVRGSTPDQSLILYDGFTVYNVEHLFGFFSTFNSNAIKDVQFFKGGFDAKYGGRLSSVVNITGKEGNQKEFNASVDISMMSVNAFVETPIGNKTTLVMAFRRSWESPIYNKIFDLFSSDNETNDTGGFSGRGGRGGFSIGNQNIKSYFYDFNSKITIRPSDKDKIAISFYSGEDNLDNSIIPEMSGMGGRFGGADIEIDLETTDLTNWGNTGLSLKWSRQFSNKLYMNTLFSYSNYFSLRDRSSSGSFTRGGTSNAISRGLNESNDLKDFTGKADFEYKFNSKNRFEFGMQFTHNDIEYSYIQNDTTVVIDRSTGGNTMSVYFQDKISLLENKLNITAGLRYNYFSETEGHYYEPRFNFMYNLTDRIKLKGSVGKYYQFAKRVVREDIQEGSRDFWVLSDNDKLPVSSCLQYIAGLSYETPKYLFDVEAYYKDLNNITEYSLRIEADRRGLDYSENFFSGTGIAKGIDFLAQKKYGKLTGWLGYTIGRVTNHITEFGDNDFFASNDVTHEFKAIATYKWRNWNFGATWIFTTGRPYTSPEGGYELTLLDGTTADYINVSVKNGNRLPDYHRFDISANYNFLLGGKSPVSLGFSIFNLYNRSNIWYKEYEIIDNVVIETPIYFLGLTPNINLTIKLK